MAVLPRPASLNNAYRLFFFAPKPLYSSYSALRGELFSVSGVLIVCAGRGGSESAECARKKLSFDDIYPIKHGYGLLNLRKKVIKTQTVA